MAESLSSNYGIVSPDRFRGEGPRTVSSGARTCVAIGASDSVVTGASASGAAPAGTAGVTASWGSDADILLDSVNLGIREWKRAEKRENCRLMNTHEHEHRSVPYSRLMACDRTPLAQRAFSDNTKVRQRTNPRELLRTRGTGYVRGGRHAEP